MENVTKGKVEIKAWRTSTNENGVVEATVNRDKLVAFLAQTEKLEQALNNKHSEMVDAVQAERRDYIAANTRAKNLEQGITVLQERISVLTEALTDIHNDIAGGVKSCGHQYTCICAGDKVRAALSTEVNKTESIELKTKFKDGKIER